MNTNIQPICPLCDSSNTIPKFNLSKYEIRHCQNCQFEFNSDFKGEGSEKDTFNKDYYTVVQKAAFSRLQEDYRNDPSFKIFNQHLEDIEKYATKGRLLDIGPGLGTFVRTAKERAMIEIIFRVPFHYR